MDQTLKRCPGCDATFTWKDLTHSPEIRPLGLVVDPLDLNHCYLHFVHAKPTCMTTFLIHSRDAETAVSEACDAPARHADECTGFCTDIHELASCTRQCRLSRHRQLIVRLTEERDSAEASILPAEQTAPEELVMSRVLASQVSAIIG